MLAAVDSALHVRWHQPEAWQVMPSPVPCVLPCSIHAASRDARNQFDAPTPDILPMPSTPGVHSLLLGMLQCTRACLQAVMRNGMAADLSWNRAALEYEQVFRWALMDAPARAY